MYIYIYHLRKNLSVYLYVRILRLCTRVHITHVLYTILLLHQQHAQYNVRTRGRTLTVAQSRADCRRRRRRRAGGLLPPPPPLLPPLSPPPRAARAGARDPLSRSRTPVSPTILYACVYKRERERERKVPWLFPRFERGSSALVHPLL